MSQKPVIVWFRQDLRLADNRSLAAAVATGAPVIPVYILDDVSPGAWRMGGASRWWLAGSLASLQSGLAALGSSLVLRRAESGAALLDLCAETKATAVYVSRSYEPWAVALEARVRDSLGGRGIALKRFSGALLAEPEQMRNQAGAPFRVYTPFWRNLSSEIAIARPAPAPDAMTSPRGMPASEATRDWGLMPSKPDWARGLREAWTPGEASAHTRLHDFLDATAGRYHEQRDCPGSDGTSRLSPHLHFGELSPSQCWHAAKAEAAIAPAKATGLEVFLKELVWREFSYHLLTHWPGLPETAFRPEFAAFPWRKDSQALASWQRGRTGYPLVDAGMRQLWHTGWMHNRVRMIVASFLIKDLLMSWQEGEAWFWDTLVDADLAANAASWQWVAGSGADAAPYFRIFNPVSQGQKFDPNGDYVRRWVPELARLNAGDIHAPWLVPEAKLKAAGVVLGRTYPLPIVDHAAARDLALQGYEAVKASARDQKLTSA